MSTTFSRLGVALSGVLVGLGVAVVARTASDVGTHHFALGYVLGPGLVVAGLARMALQRRLDERMRSGDHVDSEGRHG